MARIEEIRDALARECLAETIEGAELRADIEHTLPADEYQCVWLWLAGSTLREIAEQMQLPIATAHRRIEVALSKINELL